MKHSLIIACDGEAASGKSTGAKLLAKKYNLKLVNSGLLYRYASKLILERKPRNIVQFLKKKFKKTSYNKGPVHINVHLDEPNESSNLTAGIINTDFKKIIPIGSDNSIQINKFQNPLIICGQSNLKEYENNIFKLSQKLNIPILADISSNIESHTNNILYYDTFIDNIKPDAIFRFGKKPLSKKLNTLIKNCANTYLVRNERLFN